MDHRYFQNLLMDFYLKTRHIFKSCNIYLKPERFRKSKFTLSEVVSESIKVENIENIKVEDTEGIKLGNVIRKK